MDRIAFISNLAVSLINFRGPLLAELKKKGITVYALAPDYSADTRRKIEDLGVIPIDYSMSRVGMNPLKDFADIVSLAFVLRSLRVDATFSYYIKPVIYGLFAAKLAGVSNRFAMIEGAGYAFTDDVQISLHRRVLRSLVTCMYRFSLRFAKVVFMLNKDDKDLFVLSGMVHVDKVRLLTGIGLDLDFYKSAPPIAEPVVFLLIGRLLKEKGVYDYITAARSVKKENPSVRFLILGDVDVNPSSIKVSEVNAWVEEGIVEWPGHVNDVREWIARASVFVLPSYREGLPRSTQEAMAMGRPVITTDVPGCRETVLHKVNGFLIPVRDSESLCEAMLEFVRKPELIAEMGRASRLMAEEFFDVNKINFKIMSAIDL